MKTNTILVPLDGSDMAESAIPEALHMARSDSFTLLLIRAANARIIPGADVIGAQIIAVRDAEEYLAALKDKLLKQGVRGIETHVWYGPAASAIVEAARVNKVDLIVMTTHGRSGLGRLVFGSVAESVLRGTAVPILLIRPTGAPIERPAEPGEVRPAQKPQTTTEAEVTR
jgi:nucleotide-binding universal stress UspA family protein